MKVIFLDYDGVLNDARVGRHGVLEKHVNLIKRIIEETGAFVITISNNKNDFLGPSQVPYEESKCYLHYDRYLKEMGVEIHDYTPCIESGNIFKDRELEIHAYLDMHPEITEFVIIEDDGVIHSLAEHQVLIENFNGIKEEHVKPAIDILNGKLGFYPPEYDKSESLVNRMKRILPNFHLEETPPEMEKMDALLLKMQKDMKDFK